MIFNNKFEKGYIFDNNGYKFQNTLDSKIEIENSMEKVSSLTDLMLCIQNFDKSPLKENATNTVFCDGKPDAKIMLIGEAPGEEEDKIGKPFIGKSGKLLDLVLNQIGLSRKKNLYITNIVPWRPKDNRTPTTAEVKMFLPFVKKHINLIKPKILILAGNIATKGVLSIADGILKIHGKEFEYKLDNNETAVAIPIFHPAYLLRSPMQKKYIWQDMLQMKKLIGQMQIEL